MHACHCRYFALTTGCNAVLLGSLLLPLASSNATLSPATTSAAAVLGVGLLCSAGNFLLIEPKATSLMFQRCALLLSWLDIRCHHEHRCHTMRATAVLCCRLPAIQPKAKTLPFHRCNAASCVEGCMEGWSLG
eukprot:1158617-Pelagomonas_calceolata.AAC.2